jgi:hypothetical protein
LSEGDIMIGFDGNPVSEMGDLHQSLRGDGVGVHGKLIIPRKSEKLEIDVVPEESRVREGGKGRQIRSGGLARKIKEVGEAVYL